MDKIVTILLRPYIYECGGCGKAMHRTPDREMVVCYTPDCENYMYLVEAPTTEVAAVSHGKAQGEFAWADQDPDH
jgi:hypothetical protein